jgi:hypothetical protein
MALRICWSFSTSTFKYLLVVQAVDVLPSSGARLMADLPSGNDSHAGAALDFRNFWATKLTIAVRSVNHLSKAAPSQSSRAEPIARAHSS